MFRSYLRNKSAKRLQAQWKVYRMRSFRDGIANYGQNLACIKIQKFLKGYLVSKKFEPIKIDRRLTQNFRFFEQMREQQVTDSQVYLAYQWRKRQKKIKKEQLRKMRLELINQQEAEQKDSTPSNQSGKTDSTHKFRKFNTIAGRKKIISGQVLIDQMKSNMESTLKSATQKQGRGNLEIMKHASTYTEMDQARFQRDKRKSRSITSADNS